MHLPTRHFRHALRQLRRNPGYTTAVVVTLALGIGAVTAVFSVVNGVLLRPLPYPEPDRLVRVYSTGEHGHLWTSSPPDFTDWRAQARSFEVMAAGHATILTLTGEGEAERLQGARVTPGFFEVYGVSPRLGRGFVSDEERPGSDDVVVLGHGVWLGRFGGDASVLGRTIRLNGSPYRVVGVMPPGFDAPGGSSLWIPRSFSAEDLTTQRGAHYLNVVGRLAPDASVSAADAEMRAIAARLEAEHPDTNTGWGATVQEMRETVVGDVRPALLVLFGAVGLVLLVACANAAGLSLTRAAGRQRELAVRAALGAGRGRLAGTLLGESLVLAVLGGLGGLLLAHLGTELLLALRPEDLPRIDEVRVDPAVLAFAAGASLLTGIGFGILPALQASDRDLHGRLKEGDRALGGRSSPRLRSLLVAGEIGLCVLLLAGAALLGRSLLKLQAVDPGFRIENVLTLNVSLPDARYGPDESREFVRGLLEEARALPGVEAAGVIFGLPLTGFGYSISVERLDGGPAYERPGEEKSVQVRVVSPEYFQTLGIPVLRGRGFDRGDREGAPPVAVLSEGAATLLWPDEDALGRTLELGTRLGVAEHRAGGEVVGIVRDVRHDGPHRPAPPQVYVAHAQFPVDFLSLAVRTGGEPAALAGPIRRLVRGVDPDLALSEARTMEQWLGESLARSRFFALLLGLFAVIALLLAAVGIYGLVAYGVRRRTRELGVRMALGAASADVLRLVVRQAAAVAGAGVALGLVGAFLLTRTLRGLLFQLSPTDPATLATVTVVLIGVAMAAAWIPARRATRVDPLLALRQE